MKMSMLTVTFVLLSFAGIVTSQDCIPTGSTRGCRIGAAPTDPDGCCAGATCNFALKCLANGPVPPAPPVPPPTTACIPAGSTQGCRIAAPAGDPNRCCDGATCNLALKCVGSGPVVPPALPGTTGCIAAGTNRGCRFGDPAGDPNICCSGAYCNTALRCLTCQGTGNAVACSPTAQDTTRCCNGLACFRGVCFPLCSLSGGQCAVNTDCCGALECNQGICRVQPQG